ncbi:MAG: hypothetical protein LUE87_06780 [Lachnospiraceae bacterium]|nr:hypothetical protein [Lachnospiraceae bacterium]
MNFRLMPDKDGGKPRKVPINPETGKNAMSNKPETWTDYQTVADAVEMYGFTGIGRMFVKEDGFVGVDIDHCYDPETGQFNEVAAAILAKQPTFAEFSPSGDGVHLWFKGEKPKGSSSRSVTMERITEIIPFIEGDMEVYPLVVSTLEKMKRLSDTAFQSLDLEPYKEEPEDIE